MFQGGSALLLQPSQETEQLTPRRIRHITSIQIRNLTPFPVRDAFTTALSQLLDQPSKKEVTDDLATIIGKRRTRKSSNTSVLTRRSLKWDEATLDPEPSYREGRGRAISFSKPSGASSSPSRLAHSYTSSRSTHSLRSHRARTSSMASSSSNNVSLASVFPPSTASTSFHVPSFLVDHTQSSLEKVIESRLVETFITLTFPILPPPVESPRTNIFSPNLRSPVEARSPGVSRSQSAHATTQKTSKPSKTSKDIPVTSPPRAKVPPGGSPSLPKKPPQRPLTPKDVKPTPPPARTNGVTQRKGTSVANLSLAPEPEVPSGALSSSPSYFSSIHRPSTNPLFPIDLRSNQLPQWTDLAAPTFKVEVWGRLVHTPPASPAQTVQDEWKLLHEWDVDLNKLKELSSDAESQPVQLPSNTFVVTLSPPSKTFYLPIIHPKEFNRSPTPSAGYTSDPESDVKRVKKVEEQANAVALKSSELVALSRRRRPGGSAEDGEGAPMKSATWQDLFKVATLQSLIQDNASSLNDVVIKIEEALKEDHTSTLKRDASERETRIQEVQQMRTSILSETDEVRRRIAHRKELLRQRTSQLACAEEMFSSREDREEEIRSARAQVMSVQQRMAGIRTCLISELSSIFPIELLSPPDLLFTILDIPLPIPLTVNDPAPPLLLPEFKEVTEESVATALGYAAQVVHVLAAYTGKTLVYPVTCIGSRSLIRDGISAMVGPRMFPLFSKGVDTYRFEYGVFLLNKNIELLMSERDLRALDLRHTLPNLKNLLLTLSHDISVKLEAPRRPLSPVSSLSGIETPSRPSSPTESEVNTPKVSREASGDVSTPTASGATTPTIPSLRDESRKSRLLGFVGFPDFLRTRYSSTSQSLATETEEDGETDEADRVTLRGPTDSENEENSGRGDDVH